MTKHIVKFVDAKMMVVPKADIQAGKNYTMRILDVKAEDRYEEIHITVQLIGFNIDLSDYGLKA